MKREARDYLIVPLDVPTLKEAKDIVDEIDDLVIHYKVGLQLFTKYGPKAVEMLKGEGKRVFLDLKLHDIPNTVIGAVEAAIDMKVNMLTLHALGGFDMMESAQKVVWESKSKDLIILGVTILTSLDEAFLQDFLGIDKSMGTQILDLATLSRSAGLSGVVASPKEVSQIKEKCGEDFIVVTPGIRPEGAETGDQKRVETPDKAIMNGADYIVVGRPIIQAECKIDAVKSIIKGIERGLHKTT